MPTQKLEIRILCQMLHLKAKNVMCTEHNRSKTDEVFEVKDNTTFVAINP